MANTAEKIVKSPADVIAETLKSLSRGGEAVTKSAAQIERETRQARITAKLEEVATLIVVETEGTEDQENLSTAVRRVAIAGDYAKKALAAVPDELLDSGDAAAE